MLAPLLLAPLPLLSVGVRASSSVTQSTRGFARSDACASAARRVFSYWRWATSPCEVVFNPCLNQDEEKLKQNLAQKGPISVACDASEWGSYAGGVYHTECGKPPPLGKKCTAWGHAVKILGWGHAMVNITSYNTTTNKTTSKEVDTPYWIGANSWSRGWGEGGYFRIMHNEVGFDSMIGTQHPLPSAAQRGRKHGTHPSAEEQLARDPATVNKAAVQLFAKSVKAAGLCLILNAQGMASRAGCVALTALWMVDMKGQPAWHVVSLQRELE